MDADTSPLPRGRHGLTRAEVEGSQRERILRALAQTMARRGYAATSVADILAAAGVSRSTFYALFSSKADCFMTAFEEAAALVVAPARAKGDPGTPFERFSLALASYLDGMAASPEIARLFMVEVYAAGPEAAARRADLMERYAEAIADLLQMRTEQERFAARAVVAAVSMMVTLALTKGDTDAIAALHAPVMELVAQVAPHRGEAPRT